MRLLTLAALNIALALAAMAQPTTQPEANGFIFHGLSGGVGYTTSSYMPHSADASGSASAGLYGSGPDGRVGIRYNASYFRYLGQDTSSFNHSLSFVGDRRVNSKVGLSFSANASDTTYQQYLFVPSALAKGINPNNPATDLSGLVNGTVLNDTTQAALFGYRVLGLGAGAGISFQPTTRTTLSLNLSGSHSQNLKDDATTLVALVRRSEVFRGSVTYNYRITPLMDIGLEGAWTGVRSSLAREHYSTARVYWSKMLSPRWLISARAGAVKTGGAASAAASKGYSFTGGGTIAHQSRQQSAAFSYDRSSANTYGLNVRTVQTYSANWTWRSLNHNWSTMVGGSRQTFSGGTFAGSTSNEGEIGIQKTLGRQFSASLDYGVLFLTEPQGGSPNQRAHTARLTVTWAPFLQRSLGFPSLF